MKEMNAFLGLEDEWAEIQNLTSVPNMIRGLDKLNRSFSRSGSRSRSRGRVPQYYIGNDHSAIKRK